MKNKDSHIVIAETSYYDNSPQQGEPADGTLKAGETVSMVKSGDRYSPVKLPNGNWCL